MLFLKQHVAPEAETEADFGRTSLLIGPDAVTGQARVLTPDNHLLTPAGKQIELPGMRPQALALSPDGALLVVAGKAPLLKVINPVTGEITETVTLPSEEGASPNPVSPNILKPDLKGQVSFAGLLFSPDGTRLYLSNVNGSIKVFTVTNGVVAPFRTLPLPPANAPLRREEIPAGLAISADGKKLYIACNLSNRLAELEVESGRVLRTWECGVAPYEVRLVSGKVYVSNWGGRRPEANSPSAAAGRGMVVRVDPRTDTANEGSLSIVDLASEAAPVELVTGRHASGLAVSPDQRFLCVACAASDSVDVLDLAKGEFIGHFFPKSTPADLFGAAPNALAFSETGKTLFVCNGTQNALAVMEWKEGHAELAGLVPTGWYPGGVVVDRWHHQLIVGNVKGIGAVRGKNGGFNSHQYFGTLSLMPLPRVGDELAAFTQTVQANDRVPLLSAAFAKPRPEARPRPIPQRVGEPSVFKHVLYIIKENRTYDQVLGDLPEGNGRADLCIYGAAVTPNQHKLSQEFTLLDNTYCSGILSADGHNWSCSAITTDYVEKQFAGFPRSYPDGCTTDDVDALAWSPAGFLWNAALLRHHLVRIYGEFCQAHCAWNETGRTGTPSFAEIVRDVENRPPNSDSEIKLSATANLASLSDHCCGSYPGFDNDIPDIARAERFLADLATQETLPALMVMSLPGDHTSGTDSGKPTPRSHIADNDLALGRIVAALSASRYWQDTCIIAIEDDPQNGWDHVSGYRTTCYVASAWSRKRGTIHTQYNQTSVLRTIELILGLPPMNELDATATPMFDCFGTAPDFTPFTLAIEHLPLDLLNPATASIQDPTLRHDAEVSATLPFEEMDRCPEDVLNGILWRAERGDAPFPTWAVTAGVEED